jgi:phosphoribosyl-ATP pyrophosphohydrolase/phosphoribosyl-AMP cyclohydrolase
MSSPVLSVIRFDGNGLVPVVAQEVSDGRVLMLAYANRDAIEATLATGQAHYYSRSRASLWKKGETSGHLQWVTEVRIDCDGDALSYLVEAAGPACHTGEVSCFYRRLGESESSAMLAREGILAALGEVIAIRKKSGGGERSYVRHLLTAGAPAIAAKVTEEASEVAHALEAPEDDAALIHEVADLWFHTLVALGSRDLSAELVLAELRQRFGISGIQEKEGRKT